MIWETEIGGDGTGFFLSFLSLIESLFIESSDRLRALVLKSIKQFSFQEWSLQELKQRERFILLKKSS
jgi:hypothetical protein